MISLNRRSATETRYALSDPALKSRAMLKCRSATGKMVVAFIFQRPSTYRYIHGAAMRRRYTCLS